MRKKIAQITTVHPRTDTRIAVKEVAALASEMDAEVALFVQDGLGDAPAMGPNGYSIVDTGPRASRRLKRAVSGSWRMFRAVRRWRADVVHFHDPELIGIGVLLRLLGVRVVYDVHEDVPRQILVKHYLSAGMAKTLSKCAAMAEAVAGRVFNGIVTATPVIAKRFPEARTVTVCNFPKLAEFGPEPEYEQDERPPHFAYVGGLTEIRGCTTMIEALELSGHADLRLNLGGSFAPASYEQVLRAMPGWSRVNYVGWLQREEVVDVMRRSRGGIVVLQPTLNYLDSLPVKMFEYMASGLPVIASDFPLWREIVEGAGCGLLVDPLDPKAIAEAMDWIVEHPGEAAEMGRRGRQAVVETYSWTHESQKLVALYRDALGVPTKQVPSDQGLSA